MLVYTDKNLYYTQIGFGIIPKQNTLSVKVLLAIINSKLINFFHKYSFLDLEKELFQKILIANCKKFPIKKSILTSANSQLVSEVDLIIKLNKELISWVEKFTQLLQSKFPIDKLSKNLQSWHELDFGEFLKALKKAKVQLSLSEEAEWMGYFNEQKQKATALQQEIDRVDKEIDGMVYGLYGLGEEEIAIVEGS